MAFVGPVALTCVCVFESGLSTPIRVSLIVAPDNKFLAIQTSQTSRSKGDKLNKTKNAKYTKSTEDSDLFPEV